jgi:hypothetical protein
VQRRIGAMLRPPPQLLVSEWAERHRILGSRAASEPGPWRTTGIVGAAVTVLGIMAGPVMMRAGYDPKLSSGAIAAGGTLGILIPPASCWWCLESPLACR